MSLKEQEMWWYCRTHISGIEHKCIYQLFGPALRPHITAQTIMSVSNMEAMILFGHTKTEFLKDGQVVCTQRCEATWLEAAETSVEWGRGTQAKLLSREAEPDSIRETIHDLNTFHSRRGKPRASRSVVAMDEVRTRRCMPVISGADLSHADRFSPSLCRMCAQSSSGLSPADEKRKWANETGLESVDYCLSVIRCGSSLHSSMSPESLMPERSRDQLAELGLIERLYYKGTELVHTTKQRPDWITAAKHAIAWGEDVLRDVDARELKAIMATAFQLVRQDMVIGHFHYELSRTDGRSLPAGRFSVNGKDTPRDHLLEYDDEIAFPDAAPGCAWERIDGADSQNGADVLRLQRVR
jgi:hypothetical protein